MSGAPKKPPMIPWSPRRFIAILVGLFVLNWLIVAVFAPPEKRIKVPYSPTFLQEVRKGNVKEISSTGDTVKGEFKKSVEYKGDSAKGLETEIPTFANDRELSKLLEDNDVVISASPPGERSLLQTILFSFGPTILLVALFIFLFRRAAASAGGGGVLGQFGRSRARRVEPSSQTVTFMDVAGIEEAKQELLEVVDFLKNPEKYLKLGARIPRGVLLAGAPGTGKTLLARAVAGEASVPFFSASASEFIEAIVGIGASRVRDLFQQAKEAAPAIIFIDELDAIGRSRGGARRRTRRARRARADAQPDSHRDGRLRHGREGDRARRHQPAGGARSGAPATGTLRQAGIRAGARRERARGHPPRAHALGAAR